ncbi:MAG: FAD-dependent oxidoreductase, partial [Dehalococcoidia bacterium]
MSTSGRDVVVIGGGIVGASAAAMLAAAGARVVLVEREGLASGASGANSGVVQHPFDPVLAELYTKTVALYRELSAAEVGFQLGSAPTGLL